MQGHELSPNRRKRSRLFSQTGHRAYLLRASLRSQSNCCYSGRIAHKSSDSLLHSVSFFLTPFLATRQRAWPVFFREAERGHALTLGIELAGGASRILRLKPPLSPLSGQNMLITSSKLPPVTFDRARTKHQRIAERLFVLTGSRHLVQGSDYPWRQTGSVGLQTVGFGRTSG